jgi:hypothetical protein
MSRALRLMGLAALMTGLCAATPKPASSCIYGCMKTAGQCQVSCGKDDGPCQTRCAASFGECHDKCPEKEKHTER